jgi:ABC-type uncharacterized transport system permease subunit
MKEGRMKIGLRVILLVAAIVCFVISIFSNNHPLDWVAAGLALTTAAVLVRDLGMDMMGGRRV